jgi:hypothetical protein
MTDDEVRTKIKKLLLISSSEFSFQLITTDSMMPIPDVLTVTILLTVVSFDIAFNTFSCI